MDFERGKETNRLLTQGQNDGLDCKVYFTMYEINLL